MGVISKIAKTQMPKSVIGHCYSHATVISSVVEPELDFLAGAG